MSRPARQWLAAVAATVLLAACGGGGDDGPPPPTNDFDAQAAWANFLDGGPGSLWTVYGRGSDGQDYSLRLGVAPVGNASFPVTNTPANRADVASVLRRNGVVIGTGTSELYYDNDLQLYGSRDTFDVVGQPLAPSTCDEATAWDIPPIAAKIGASGLLATNQVLDGCTTTSGVLGSSTVRWSLEWIWGVSFFCVGFDEQSNGGLRTREKHCFETDAAGHLGTRAYVLMESPGFVLEMSTP